MLLRLLKRKSGVPSDPGIPRRNRTKQAVGSLVFTAIHIAGATASSAGGVIALAVGKFLLAVVLALIAIGLFFRLIARRKISQRIQPAVFTRRQNFVAGLVSLGAAALVVETINLPVRVHQLGFEKSNLLIVVGIVLLCFWGVRWLTRFVVESK